MRIFPAPRFVVVAAAAVILAVLPFQISGYHQGIATRVAVYFIAILGLNILTGYTGQISIGHGAFMAIGGYVTAIMSHDHHTNLIATLPLAFAITFACGVLVGIPALRLSGVYLALATFALAVSVPQFPLKFSKFLGGSNGMHTANTESHLWLYIVGWRNCVGSVISPETAPRTAARPQPVASIQLTRTPTSEAAAGRSAAARIARPSFVNWKRSHRRMTDRIDKSRTPRSWRENATLPSR